MKIYLVYPDVSSFHGLPYHPGLASIASFLIAKGHDVRLSYFKSAEEMKYAVEKICAFKPDVVGFTAVETQFRYARYLASEIKKRWPCVIICGGPYASLAPEIVLRRNSVIDAAVVGEGEYAMGALLERLWQGRDWRSVNNLAYMDKTDNLIRNLPYHFIKDLDSLPYPSKELFPYQEIIDRENIAMFHFNRGCPYHCAYCSNEALGNLYNMPSNQIRFRSIESAMHEIEETLLQYKLRDDTVLHFGDDLFIFNRQWILKFCDLYRKKIRRPFWCTGRSNHITEEICSALKNAGCIMLMMSVESGDDYIRNEVMMRNISRETLFRSFDICQKSGINTLATCVIGLPFETTEMIDNSINVLSQLKSIVAYGINIFYPYHGTRLREICEKNGFMPERIGDDFVERKESILNLPDLPKDKILYYYRNWTRLIMRHKNAGERIKFETRDFWNKTRKTFVGKTIRAFINDTKFGRHIKRYVMRYVWNRSYVWK